MWTSWPMTGRRSNMLEWMTEHRGEIRFHHDAAALKDYLISIRANCSTTDIKIYFREKLFGIDKFSFDYANALRRGELYAD